jgi:hypothetical protein
MSLRRAGIAMALCILALNCREGTVLTLRTDPEPLARRLHLPAQIRGVRWVAVSSVTDTGGVPGPVDFYDIYAYVEIGPEGWTELEHTAGRTAARGTVSIPEPVAAVLLPDAGRDAFTRSEAARRGEGPAFDPVALVADEKAEVAAAVRVGEALVVQMRVR